MTHERDCDQLTSGSMNGCVCGLIKKVRAEAEEPFRHPVHGYQAIPRGNAIAAIDALAATDA